MPRDSSGNYSLPPSNPVASGTIITSSWANGTCSDIATELTNSVDRNGRGAMLAPFKLTDGAVNAPGLAFNSEPSSGLYRLGANDIRMSVAGQDAFGFSYAAAPGKLTAYMPLNITGDLNAPSGSVFRKNAIINGDMRIAQRGVSFPALASGAYGLDRWKVYRGGTMVATIAQSAPGPPQAGNGPVFQNAQSAVITTPQATLAATDNFQPFSQVVEGYDWALFAQRRLTLSFWFWSNITGTFSVSLRNSVPDRSIVFPIVYSTASTWQFFQYSVPPSPSAGTWNYTNGTGVQFAICTAAGSSMQTATTGSWVTGNFVASTGITNGVAAVNNAFYLTGVQLEVNPTGVATDFEFASFADALARCRRYYWKTFPYGVAPAQNAGTAGAIAYQILVAAGPVHMLTITFPTLMRVAPTITFFNPAAANANWRNISRPADSGAPALGVGAGDATLAIYDPGAAGEAVNQTCAVHISADAEL